LDLVLTRQQKSCILWDIQGGIMDKPATSEIQNILNKYGNTIGYPVITAIQAIVKRMEAEREINNKRADAFVMLFSPKGPENAITAAQTDAAKLKYLSDQIIKEQMAAAAKKAAQDKKDAAAAKRKATRENKAKLTLTANGTVVLPEDKGHTH
jgi:ferredoxin-NADP reductase